MPQKIIISSDSTCDLSKEVVEKYGITISPLSIVMGDSSYYDGVDVTADDVFECKNKTGKLAKTSAPNLNECTQFINSIHEDGAAHIHFTISSEMSSAWSNYKTAGLDTDDFYVVDSANLSTGIGLLVLRACDLREKGLSAAEIYEDLEQTKKRVDASFVLDTLEYLHKGGRCSSVAALGANLLKLKPCIEVKNGKMDVAKKYRGKIADVLMTYTKDRLANVEDLEFDRVFVTHTMTADNQPIVESVKQYIKDNVPFKEIIETRAGCSVSVHCGPNTLGVLFIRKSDVG